MYKVAESVDVLQLIVPIRIFFLTMGVDIGQCLREFKHSQEFGACRNGDLLRRRRQLASRGIKEEEEIYIESVSCIVGSMERRLYKRVLVGD